MPEKVRPMILTETQSAVPGSICGGGVPLPPDAN